MRHRKIGCCCLRWPHGTLQAPQCRDHKLLKGKSCTQTMCCHLDRGNKLKGMAGHKDGTGTHRLRKISQEPVRQKDSPVGNEKHCGLTCMVRGNQGTGLSRCEVPNIMLFMMYICLQKKMITQSWGPVPYMTNLSC